MENKIFIRDMAWEAPQWKFLSPENTTESIIVKMIRIAMKELKKDDSVLGLSVPEQIARIRWIRWANLWIRGMYRSRQSAVSAEWIADPYWAYSQAWAMSRCAAKTAQKLDGLPEYFISNSISPNERKTYIRSYCAWSAYYRPIYGEIY